jgi:hypothetical protein
MFLWARIPREARSDLSPVGTRLFTSGLPPPGAGAERAAGTARQTIAAKCRHLSTDMWVSLWTKPLVAPAEFVLSGTPR